jgi:hypothetical protein
MTVQKTRRTTLSASRAPAASTNAWDPIPAALGLLVLAWLVRALFVAATPDAAWGYSAAFKGDALVWLEAAARLRQGLPVDEGLPIHPPATAWLLALLWDGQPASIAGLRQLWALMGAAVPALVYLAARRALGDGPALVTGALCALSTGLVLLSASIDNETPYLLLLWTGWPLLEFLRQRGPRAGACLAFGAWHGLACLFRVEHAFFALASTLWLVWAWRSQANGTPRPWASSGLGLGLAALAALAVLSPWHLQAWRALQRANEAAPPTTAIEEATLRSLERQLAQVEWDASALRRRDELPALARRQAALFVAATVAQRGGSRVYAQDFDVLAQAFGSVPRPLPRHPFVSLYGPLNFALANHAGADGGFSPALLAAAPPLQGGAARYPAALVANLPPPQLALVYPPHLALVNDGYTIGMRWIRDEPRAFVSLLGRKLARFWSGVATGLGGFGLPVGRSGTRWAVDLAVAGPGVLNAVWQGAWLALAALGAWHAWRRRPTAGAALPREPASLVPWSLFLINRLLVTVAFFGYARQGAMAVPVVALLVALGLHAALPARAQRRLPTAVALLAGLLLLIEGARYEWPPALRLDQRAVLAGQADPLAPDHHAAVTFEER